MWVLEGCRSKDRHACTPVDRARSTIARASLTLWNAAVVVELHPL